jgi:hypothetical protein
MPEDVCGPRLRALRAQREALLARQAELLDALAATDLAAPSARALAGLRRRVRDGLAMEGVPAKKALLRSLVAQVGVAGRYQVTPWFRVPSSANTNTLPFGEVFVRWDVGQLGFPQYEPRTPGQGTTLSL